jgi:hypothetical protein
VNVTELVVEPADYRFTGGFGILAAIILTNLLKGLNPT